MMYDVRMILLTHDFFMDSLDVFQCFHMFCEMCVRFDDVAM